MKPLSVLCGILPAALLAVQQPAAPQRPTFRASTELVTIDVSVLDRNGAPARELTPDDFVVKVDGQPRRIVSLQFVDQGLRAAPGLQKVATRPVVSSNEAGGGGRLVLIVVDESTIRFGGLRAAAESVGRLLAGFGPSDRIGLATLPGPRALVDFTQDHQRIVEAMKRIPAGALPLISVGDSKVSVAEAYDIERSSRVPQEIINRECAGARGSQLQMCIGEIEATAKNLVVQTRNQTEQFSGGMRSVLQALRAVDAPKILILFSEGFLSPEAASDLTSLAYDAAAARTVIHVMRLDRVMFDVSERNPRGSFFEEQSTARASLSVLAGASRGAMFEIIGSGDGPFQRLALEVSGYYLIAIEPEATDRDGKRHRVQVDAVKPGLTIRARPDFAVEPPRAVAAEADESKVLLTAIQSPMLSTGIPIRVGTFNMADDDPGRVRVMVAAEIDRQQQADASARIGYAIFDEKGKAVTAFAQPVELTKTAEGALAFVNVVAVPPGTYTLKLAAVREGRTGSVEHRLTARLSKAPPILFGDLIVDDPPERARQLSPSLDSHVMGDRILGFVQLRAPRDLPKDTALVLDIVKQENGPALLTAPFVLGTSKTSIRVAQAMVDARLLPPGEYGARLTITAGGKPAGKAFTEFSLDRTVGAAPSGGPPVVPPWIPRPAPFEREQVLAPAVVGPFLDALGARTPGASPAAIERARAGRFEEALQQLKGGGANDATSAFIRGLALYSKGDLQSASNAFRDVLRVAPDFLGGAFYIGACYAAGGREQQAINAWQTSLAGLEEFPAVYRVLADGMLRASQPAPAVELLQEAVTKWPDDDGLRLRLARASLESGQYDRALEHLDRLNKSESVDASLLFMAMQAVFQQALQSPGPVPEALRARLRRYRDLYVAAKGAGQPLVAEWVAFVEKKAGQRP